MKKPRLYLHEKVPYKTDKDMKYGHGEGLYRLKLIAKYSHGKVLDVGFAGHPNPYLKNVIGLDMVKADKPQNYIEVHKGDAMNMPFKDKTFDSIVAGDVIEHLENPSKFLRECKRVLKNDGTLVISTPNAAFLPLQPLEILFIKKFYFNDTHINLFQPRIMYKLLRYAGFNLIKRVGAGMYIPFTRFTLPLPTAFSQHIIYISKKWKLD